MIHSFKFNLATFDTEEFNEIILEVPITATEENQNAKVADDRLIYASVNEMATLIVSEMMVTVKKDLSSIKRSKA
jgi:hypothetical protein